MPLRTPACWTGIAVQPAAALLKPCDLEMTAILNGHVPFEILQRPSSACSHKKVTDKHGLACGCFCCLNSLGVWQTPNIYLNAPVYYGLPFFALAQSPAQHCLRSPAIAEVC